MPKRHAAAAKSIRSNSPDELDCLTELERQSLWLSAWTIHNANNLRPHPDGLKVGGHLASCASIATMMTALYFGILRPEDRVAVKPHAAPLLHAMEYMCGRQTRERLERFRALGGAQSYPSRTKDAINVDFSTGSVGLGAAITIFAALAQDYLRQKGLIPPERAKGRMIALVGDAELDEGNIYEALLEGWKHDVRDVWWIIDYNRQSLDAVVSDRLSDRIDSMFRATGWDVVTLKYGKLLQKAFAGPDGGALRDWIDNMDNASYSALTFKGGAAWREALTADLGKLPGIRALLSAHDDEALGTLMTNLGGHDLEAILEAFRAIDHDRPVAFIAYTIKGHSLPLAGHKDNHAGLMNPEQMAEFKRRMKVADGAEWEPFSCCRLPEDKIKSFMAGTPYAAEPRHDLDSSVIDVPVALPAVTGEKMSTQEAFGRLLAELARGDSELARRIVTTSPDVTVSTNLGGWVNRRGVFARNERPDTFQTRHVASMQRWGMGPDGQHIELGIAENNLFLLLAALGLTAPLLGARLLPVGTLYDPFIARGLDALNYACYQDSRFILAATPSGVTLAPEGGAHQSIGTPLIGMTQPNLTYFEPAYVDELSTILRFAFEEIQRRDGTSVYLRLSTRPLVQPKRTLTRDDEAAIVAGGYWVVPPGEGCSLAIAYSGAIAKEARDALDTILEDVPGAGLLAVTSPDQLHKGWQSARRTTPRGKSQVEELLEQLPSGSALVTVIDGHPSALSWMAGVGAFHGRALGVEKFGQSGGLADLYRTYGIDAEAIIDACAGALADRLRRRG